MTPPVCSSRPRLWWVNERRGIMKIRRMCWSLAKEGNKCRVLRSWIGENEDAKNRVKRARSF